MAMGEPIPTILVVDDEVFNLEILSEHLEDAGYAPIVAENGRQAWNLLKETPERFDAVLLDRMMPEMDGMEVLAQIKAHPTLSALPVILQTAKAAKEDVLEGLQAGAYYYLTKPFNNDQLLAILKTAVGDYQHYRLLQQETQHTSHALTLMDKGQFTFRTLKEGRDLVTLLSNAHPEAAKVVMGLSELVINAVEHGNLGITYDDKSRLNEEGTWEEEVERRLALPENATKTVSLSFERARSEVRFLIHDQGDGFDWQDYLEMSPDRIFDTHGRGIAMARMVSFDQLEYLGNGNQVVATITMNPADA
ncbi:MAG: response regulator [Gammaproteobacteria bacterium]|nr:response regulator [Gammaproteobacteria bacterium]